MQRVVEVDSERGRARVEVVAMDPAGIAEAAQHRTV
jgi:hypothetical protein